MSRYLRFTISGRAPLIVMGIWHFNSFGPGKHPAQPPSLSLALKNNYFSHFLYIEENAFDNTLSVQITFKGLFCRMTNDCSCELVNWVLFNRFCVIGCSEGVRDFFLRPHQVMITFVRLVDILLWYFVISHTFDQFRHLFGVLQLFTTILTSKKIED